MKNAALELIPGFPGSGVRRRGSDPPFHAQESQDDVSSQANSLKLDIIYYRLYIIYYILYYYILYIVFISYTLCICIYVAYYIVYSIYYI